MASHIFLGLHQAISCFTVIQQQALKQEDWSEATVSTNEAALLEHFPGNEGASRSITAPFQAGKSRRARCAVSCRKPVV